ncbi:LacI family DNA-binding transcriptional regulator [Leifsonia aquatica]|uniref:LacI family DNA-binding transcriptional regulator n=1 Tax=Leifsonia aquatica TaxID=144185 RepID=UPI000468FF9F|nr:LacI family DNA-binding transcriptional regulator [Leifsonia aquatica]
MVKASSSESLNIQTVAAAAGVSKTTVSHVLSGKRPVSPATRRRVERVMEELGYQPNFFAQALNSRRSNSVALLVQDITNPFYPALARGVQSVVASADQVVMLFDVGAGEGFLDAFVRDAIQRHVDGVIIAVNDEIEPQLLALHDAGIPVVGVGSGLSESPLDWVSADDIAIGTTAVAHLRSVGHRRIATISGPIDHEPGRGRYEGYRRAVREHGLDESEDLRIAADFTREGGYAAMKRLLRLDPRPEAVVCANDLMAIGALDAALEAGLAVPDDIAIMGVDDIDAAGLVRPALSTVRVPAEEIGRAAGDLLLQRMEEPSTEPARHILVQHSLVRRQSA